jgi:hypothetical protein
MQQIICGDYSAEIFPIHRQWAAGPLYRVAVYERGELIYENLEGDLCRSFAPCRSFH